MYLADSRYVSKMRCLDPVNSVCPLYTSPTYGVSIPDGRVDSFFSCRVLHSIQRVVFWWHNGAMHVITKVWTISFLHGQRTKTTKTCRASADASRKVEVRHDVQFFMPAYMQVSHFGVREVVVHLKKVYVVCCVWLIVLCMMVHPSRSLFASSIARLLIQSLTPPPEITLMS